MLKPFFAILKSAEMVFNISHNMSYGKPSTSAMRNHRSACQTYHESGDSNVVRDRHLSRHVWRKKRHWCEGVRKHRCWEIHSGSFEVLIFRDENFDAGIFPDYLFIMDRSCRECNLLPCDEKVSHPDPRSSSITINHH